MYFLPGALSAAFAGPRVIIVHYVAKTVAETAAITPVSRRVLEAAEPVPPGTVWLDMVEPTVAEDQKVEHYLGCKIPSRADPDFAVPPEFYYAENGVRYLHGKFRQRTGGHARRHRRHLRPYAGHAGHRALRSRRRVRDLRTETLQVGRADASSRCGGGRPCQCDHQPFGARAGQGRRGARSIASTVFRAKGDQGARSQIYSATLDALGREDEKISNLRESLVSIERLLLFLSSEGRSTDAPKPVREATKSALRDLQSLEQDAGFKAQKVQFLLDATLGLINLAQNDIIKLFSVLAVIFMPPTVIASIYGMNFKEMPELEWRWGYPLALCLMVAAAIGPYLFFRWKKWL